MFQKALMEKLVLDNIEGGAEQLAETVSGMAAELEGGSYLGTCVTL
jgi:hypothetical protein